MNDLELLNYRYDGMLADGGTVDGSILTKLYDYILDKPLKALELLACTGGNANKTGDCVVKLGKEICNETEDIELCEMVEKAEVVNNASKLLIGNESPSTPAPSAQMDIITPLNILVSEFKNIDCSQLSESQRGDLVNRLNTLESAFSGQGRLSEFNSMLAKLNCDVVDEFKCDADSQFETQPRCKRKFLTVWGKPLAIGGRRLPDYYS